MAAALATSRYWAEEREFDYVPGAERALERAEPAGWTVVSLQRDWATVF
jgi:hypothetical protein